MDKITAVNDSQFSKIYEPFKMTLAIKNTILCLSLFYSLFPY